jgi:hypothetical protein
MYSGMAQAITLVPPTPVDVTDLSVGSSVSINFKTGDWHEFIFTVAAGATDDLNASNARDSLTVENFTGTGTYISGPLSFDVPFSLAYTAGTYDVYIELASTDDPNNTISLTSVVSSTPLPAALPLFAGGLGMFGLLAGRRKRKASAALAA